MAGTDQDRAPKYMEGYLEKREKGKLLSLERKRFSGIESRFGSLKAGWSKYWTVVRGPVLYFFTDGNTHVKENLLGILQLGPLTTCDKGKSKKSKHTEWHEFDLKADDGKKYQFRASSDIHRDQWIYVIGLAARQIPPSPLPGEPGFEPNPVVKSPVSELPDDVINGLVRKQGKALSFNTHVKKLNRGQELMEEPQTAVSGAKETTPIYDDFPKEQWFMGKLSRASAENVLEGQPTGTYIARESETDSRAGSYTLSVRHSARVKHHRIETNENGQLVIKGHAHRTFGDLATLVEFFVRTQKDIELVPYAPKSGKDEDGIYMPMDEPITEEEYTTMDQGTREEEYTTMDSARTIGDGCEAQMKDTEGEAGYLVPSMAKMSLGERVGSYPGSQWEHHTYVNIPCPRQTQASGYAQRSTAEMYENMPEKPEEPVPPLIPRRQPTSPVESHAYSNYSSPQERQEGPPLPPRRGKSLVQLHGYENLPPKPAASVRRSESSRQAEQPKRRHLQPTRSATLKRIDVRNMQTSNPSLMARPKYY